MEPTSNYKCFECGREASELHDDFYYCPSCLQDILDAERADVLAEREVDEAGL